MAPRRIKVLVVDDSPVIRRILSEQIQADPRFEVVGAACDAFEARDMIVKLEPDVMTLDVSMPRMDGVDFLRRLMAQWPIPTIMVSSLTQKGAQITLDALEAGAVDAIAKPSAVAGRDGQAFAAQVREKLAVAATVNAAALMKRRAAMAGRQPETSARGASRSYVRDLIVAGASTGGTEALAELLVGLPVGMPPIVAVQHLPPGFTDLFAHRLDSAAPMRVQTASNGTRLEPGTAYIAPAGVQCQVVRRGTELVTLLRGEIRVSGHCPSVDVLMESAAKAAGPRAVGVLLTGMGQDGARGMVALRKAGAPTIGEAEETCVVYGMPKAAMRAGGVALERPLHEVAGTLLDLAIRNDLMEAS